MPRPRRTYRVQRPARASLITASTAFSHGSLWTLAQLQRGQSKECKHQRGDPEAHDDLRFRPTEQLEVVVQRRHLEDTFLAQLVAADLQDDRERLDHEDASDERQQQLLL